GGTGALGTAVVRALVERGATCRVSFVHQAEAARFALRDHAQVKLVECDLADEAAVAQLYQVVPALWASIHLAGGFAAKPLAKTEKAELTSLLDTNFVTCFLCCRAAVNAMG